MEIVTEKICAEKKKQTEYLLFRQRILGAESFLICICEGGYRSVATIEESESAAREFFYRLVSLEVSVCHLCDVVEDHKNA